MTDESINANGAAPAIIAEDAPTSFPTTVEKKRHYIVEMEVPGFKKKQLQLILLGNLLVVEGYKKDKRVKKKGVEMHGYEYAFKQAITLPDDIMGCDMKATFSNGLLRLRIPKLRPEHIKTIVIKVQ
jgi:HSP20 family protein